MRVIYLIRHGYPDFPNGKIVIQGSSIDLDMHPKAFADASNLKQFFADKAIDNWYHSPLKRARQTLLQLSSDINPICLKDAIEVGYGRWEGKSWDENRKADPELFAKRESDNTTLPPDGEDMRKAAKRMLNAVLSTEGNCVIATHWTVISLLYCLVENYPYEQYMQIPHPYLGVSKIIEDNGLLKFEYVGKKVCPTPFCDSINYH